VLANALPVSAIAYDASSISLNPTLCGFVNCHLISTISSFFNFFNSFSEVYKSSQPLWSLINFFCPSTSLNKPLVALTSEVVVYAFCFLNILRYSSLVTLSVAPLNFNSSPNGLSSNLPL